MRIYRGWYIVAANILILTLVVGIVINSFGLYVLPVSHELHLSRADTYTGLVLLNIGMALCAPVIGRLLDIFSPRLVMGVSAVVLGVSLIALAKSTSVALSAVVLAIPLAASVVGAGTLTATTLAARWFTFYRGRAIALTVLGMSLGMVLMSPVAAWLIEAHGWRNSLVIFAVALTCTILLLLPLMRKQPRVNDIERAGISPAQVNAAPAPPRSKAALTPLQIMAVWTFWALTVSAGIGLGTIQTVFVSIVPIASDQGMSTVRAAGLLSFGGMAAITGKMSLAWFGDRLDRIKLLAALFCIVGVVSAILTVAHAYWTFVFCALGLGLGIGVIIPCYLAALADKFGAASFGSANGLASFITATIGAACTRFGGEVFDRTGSYDLLFAVFTLMNLLAVAMMLSIRRAAASPIAPAIEK